RTGYGVPVPGLGIRRRPRTAGSARRGRSARPRRAGRDRAASRGAVSRGTGQPRGPPHRRRRAPASAAGLPRTGHPARGPTLRGQRRGCRTPGRRPARRAPARPGRARPAHLGGLHAHRRARPRRAAPARRRPDRGVGGGAAGRLGPVPPRLRRPRAPAQRSALGPRAGLGAVGSRRDARARGRHPAAPAAGRARRRPRGARDRGAVANHCGRPGRASGGIGLGAHRGRAARRSARGRGPARCGGPRRARARGGLCRRRGRGPGRLRGDPGRHRGDIPDPAHRRISLGPGPAAGGAGGRRRLGTVRRHRSRRRRGLLVKIVSVSAFPLRVPPAETYWGARTWGEGTGADLDAYPPVARRRYAYSRTIDTVLVRVETDDGVVGWGECKAPVAPSVAAACVNELLRPIVLGSSLDAIAVTWERMYAAMRVRGHDSGFWLEAIAGVDIALWDAWGRTLGQPVYALLGGAFREAAPVYASGVPAAGTREGAEGLRRVEAEARRLRDAGWTAIKVAVGVDPEGDAASVAVVRDVLGPGGRVFADAAGAYD